MTKMRAVQIPRAGGPLELVERDIPVPGPGCVLVRVQACGVCHSDVFVKEGGFPGLTYPRVPGHEVAGLVEALGPGVKGWQVGQRVGVGWYGGHCGYCDSCRRGDFVTCLNTPLVTGVSFDGGYADYLAVPATTLALIPPELTPVEAAPLMCAGVTTFNPLRNSGARPGDIVAVQGIGGLGHLGVQFAARMGFLTVAIARGKDKEAMALKLGARRYLDSTSQDAAAELAHMGGARVILATATSSKAMSALIGGLGVDGKMIIVGVPDDPLEVLPIMLILKRQSIAGWPSGAASDSQDTLAFSALTGVRPMTEVYPLERAQEAYDRMISGEARFRAVLTTGA